MSSLIERQAAIDAVQQHRESVLGGYEYDEGTAFVYAAAHNHIIDVIKHLPSAQQWIPWDRGKFPKESGTYTVTAYDGATKRVTYAKYQKRLKRWELTGARAYWRVLAWMEKPEPWKGEQDG